MADIMGTAVSGLIAFQRALAVTGNNIANANTVGYSRQSATLTDRQPDGTAGVYIGNGVDVTSVSRAFDQFTVDQLRSGNAQLGSTNSFLNVANQVDTIIGGTSNGISAGITAFFNAWQTLASDPTSASNRQQVLSQAQSLASSISQASGQLDTLQGNIGSQIRTTVSSITSIMASLAKLNDTIATATAQDGGGLPNDLMDQRDALITKLSTLVDIKTNPEANGAVDVFTANGQALVVNNKSSTVGTQANAFDSTRLDITLGTGGGQQIITSTIGGGQLGGLLQATSQLITPTRNGLGQIATAIASQVNAQQSIGMDLNGKLGQPIFSVGLPQVTSNPTNTGGATLTPQSVDIQTLTKDDYLLHYGASGWSATVAGTGQIATVTTGGVPAGSQITVGGVTLSLNGAPPQFPAAGDTFLLQPTALASRSIKTVMTDSRGIAAAAPIKTAASLSNVGNATISLGAVQASKPVTYTIPNANLLTPVSIVFQTPPTSYSVNGGPAAAFTSGQPINLNGWSATITGAPSAGDTFTVGPNTSGSGDNRNAVLMAQLQGQGVLVGGTVGISASYSSLVGVVGTAAQQATTAQGAQQSVVNQANAAVSSVSGVNLNEEAANMLKWQQAYAASAKMVATVDNMFQTLLAATKV